MGCDIHVYAERETPEGWEHVKVPGDEPFGDRHYARFAFMANVRNYYYDQRIAPISEPRDMPRDASPYVAKEASEGVYDGHSHSWLSIQELRAFDYDVVALRGLGGRLITFRDMLGAGFFKDLERLEEAGADRIVFWFDN